MTSLQPAIVVGRDEGDDLRWGRRHDGRDEVGRDVHEITTSVLLPRGDERPGPIVVDEGGARGGERQTATPALGTTAHRPVPGRPAALTERRRDPDEGTEAGPAHRVADQPADRTALR